MYVEARFSEAAMCHFMAVLSPDKSAGARANLRNRPQKHKDKSEYDESFLFDFMHSYVSRIALISAGTSEHATAVAAMAPGFTA